ncbi:hypothetical protein B0H10DRAFT_2110279 [Mycena sp. CBHHK59/15]|nr:hypothetical protein B0H10DRAFT_2110279 [Mycena sp. CBHHK59/15]
MWTLVFRAGVGVSRSARGPVLRRSYSARGTKVTAYIRDLSSFTRDPLWRLIIALHSPQRHALSEALEASHVSLDDFSRWRPLLYASDIDKAMSVIVSSESTTPLSAQLPSWLALYLAGFKVRTAHHASASLMHLSFVHIQVAPPTIQAPLLVIAMMHLARFDLILPMQRVIDAFLRVPLSQFPSVHFNHLLTAMTSIRTRSHESGANAVKVLRSMEARQLRLWPQTCSALLEDRYAALQLTGYLRRRMTSLGVAPTASQLESYLRVYSTDGAIHDAERYAAIIRGLRRYTSLPASDQDADSAHANRTNRANTLLIRSQPDSASAFQFLLNLAAKTTRDRPFFPRRRSSTHPRHLMGKRGVDVYDWTSAFTVAANDHAVSAKMLILVFLRSRPKAAEFRATAASHTVLIRGLLVRHQWDLAYIYWTKLARSGLPIDSLALAAGLQAVTQSGRPAEAFHLLENHAARADAPLGSHYRVRRPVRIATSTINIFMSSLYKILRPDLVFRLWDAMEDLYGVQPTAETLRIVLEAAQLPHTLDDSFSGQMALLALKNPFRQPEPPPASRTTLLASITTQATAPYRSGVWRGRPAADTAARIFHQALFSTPDHLHLAALPPPAYAVRTHAESDSAAPTLRLDLPRAPFVLPREVLAPTKLTFEPRERVFAAYVRLLGMARRAPEIARVLVWMRALGVRPCAATLGAALAFWGEVSVQPPLIAAMAGREGDEYLKLVRWLREWCPEEVPDEDAVALWRARIGQIRAQRRESVGLGRLLDENWT